MAQSKIGGTKAFIHGKVGTEVYYTDHDLEGTVIQVVKAVPDTVRNPRTVAQNKGRIIMATLYKAIGVLAPIVNHSFEGVAKGRPSIAHFFSENYRLIKKDIEDHPNEDYSFGLVQWKGMSPRPGAYLISHGELEFPSRLKCYYTAAYNSLRPRLVLPMDSSTMQNLKQYLNVEIGDFITILCITMNGDFKYAKLTWKYTGDMSLPLSQELFFEAFKVEGNLTIELSKGASTVNNVYYWCPRQEGCSMGMILTKYIDDVPLLSSETMSVCEYVGDSFMDALASYPKGDKYYY